jgi:hypothetical protein
LQAPILLLQPLDFISESQVVLLEPLEQLHDLRVSQLLSILVDDLLLQLLILLSQHIHVVFEQIDVLSHTLHLLLVLLYPFSMVLSFTIHLLLYVSGLLVRGKVRLG